LVKNDTQKRDEAYEAPEVRVIGSVHTLTGDILKRFNASDGLTFMGTPIGNASP
jgi:hypothetical protein